jgi:hypothetical protein
MPEKESDGLELHRDDQAIPEVIQTTIRDEIDVALDEIESISNRVYSQEEIAFSALDGVIQDMELTPDDEDELRKSLFDGFKTTQEFIIFMYAKPPEERQEMIKEKGPQVARFISALERSLKHEDEFDIKQYLEDRILLERKQQELLPKLQEVVPEMHTQFYKRIDYPRLLEAIDAGSDENDPKRLYWDILDDFRGMGQQIHSTDTQKSNDFFYWEGTYRSLSQRYQEHRPWLLTEIPNSPVTTETVVPEDVRAFAQKAEQSIDYYRDLDRLATQDHLTVTKNQQRTPYVIQDIAMLKDERLAMVPPELLGAVKIHMERNVPALLDNRPFIETIPSPEEVEAAENIIRTAMAHNFILPPEKRHTLPTFIRYPYLSPFAEGRVPDYYKRDYPNLIVRLAVVAKDAYAQFGIDLADKELEMPSPEDIEQARKSLEIPVDMEIFLRFSSHIPEGLQRVVTIMQRVKEDPQCLSDIEVYALVSEYKRYLSELDTIQTETLTYEKSAQWIEDRELTVTTGTPPILIF